MKSKKNLPLRPVEKKSAAFDAFKNTKNGYVLMDISGNIRQMNAKAKQILGFDSTKEKVNVQKMICKKDFGATMKSVTQLFKEGTFKNHNARVTTKSGTIKRLHIDTQVLYNDLQKPIGIHGVIREIKNKSQPSTKSLGTPNSDKFPNC